MFAWDFKICEKRGKKKEHHVANKKLNYSSQKMQQIPNSAIYFEGRASVEISELEAGHRKEQIR